MLDSPTLDPRQLRDGFGRFASGITVVSLLDDRGRATGVTVSSFSSLSLDPPLCLFSLGRNQPSLQWVKPGSGFNVNVLGHGQQSAAWQFARPREDKFDGVDWYQGRNGLPVIAGALCHFECSTWNLYDGGDHVIVVGQVEHLQEGDGEPLVFYRGQMATVT